MPERAAPETCANCGATIPRGAKACPECGADERSGWRETDVYDGLDLPDEAYGDRGRRQPGPRQINRLAWYWWIIGLVLACALILSVVYWH
jgi:hypothetical protein